MSNITEVLTHPWEKMYKAPYKCVGMYSLPSPSLAESNPTAYMMQLQSAPVGWGCGTCNICMTALINNYLMVAADGKKFVVGCDCVMKTNDYRLVRQMKGFKRDHETNQRIAKKAAETKKRLNAERERNGGLTDAEVAIETRKKEREDYYLANAELFDKVKATGNSFALNVLDTVVQFRSMSEKQKDFFEKAVAEHAAKLLEKNEYFGNIGDKITRTLTVKTIMGFDGFYGRTYIVRLQDAEGRTFIYKGTAIDCFDTRDADTFDFKFSIAAHEEYNGTFQTKIQRVKKV